MPRRPPWKHLPQIVHGQREVREVRKRLTGDRAAAAGWVGRARVWLGMLKAQMTRQGLPQGQARRQLPNGVRVEVGSAHGIDWIAVHVPAEVSRGARVRVFYLDSGFLAVGFASTEGASSAASVNPSRLWQNGRTSLMYSPKEPWKRPTPVNVVDGGQSPPSLGYTEAVAQADGYTSLWQKTRNFYATAVYPGVHTGIGKLYAQARAGRLLREFESGKAPRTHGLSNTFGATRNSQSLYRVAGGDYWVVSIADEGARISFTKLKVPSDLLLVYEGDKTLINETFMLAYAEVDGDWPVFSQDVAGFDQIEDAGKPVAYGWHFNWDGTRAAIVLHQGIRRYSTNNSWDVDTTAVEMEITFSPPAEPTGLAVISAQINVLETDSWRFAFLEDFFWYPAIDAVTGQPIHCHWAPPGGASGLTTYANPIDVPIYCYYTGSAEANNTLEFARYTKGNLAAEWYGWLPDCGSGPSGSPYNTFYLCAPAIVPVSQEWRSGNNPSRKFTFGAVSVLGRKMPSNIRNETFITWTYEPVGEYTDEFTGIPKVVTEFGEGCGSCPTEDAIDPHPTDADYYSSAIEYSSYGSTYVNNNEQNRTVDEFGAALVIPFNCAEGVSLVQHESAYGTVRETLDEDDTPDSNFSYVTEVLVVPFAGDSYRVPVNRFTQISGPFSNSSSSDIYYRRTEAEIKFIDRSGAQVRNESYNFYEKDPLSYPSDFASPLAKWVIDGASSCLGNEYITLIQGIGDESYTYSVEFGAETHNGFPAALEEQSRVATIGAA